MTTQTKRTRRVATSIQQTIGETLLLQIRDPRIQRAGLVTVSDVEVSKDLKYAKVYISVSDQDEAVRREVLEGFAAAKAFIRGRIGRSLPLKRVPELSFHLDKTLDNALRIEQILKEVSPDSKKAVPSRVNKDPDSEQGEGE